MDVVFISACQKNALRRTRAVLDRYAFRLGETAWSTPITQEGLRALQRQLRATASRNTAVLCLQHDRRRGLVPLWVVGNRAQFDENGRTPVFVTEGLTRRRTQDAGESSWWDEIKRIAAISGHLHDIGKNNQFFAKKILTGGPIADPIRHEWISTRIIEALEQDPGKTLGSVWDAAVGKFDNEQLDSRLPSCRDAFSAVLFCVATHHRMLHEERNSHYLDARNLIPALQNDRDSLNIRNAIDPSLIKYQAADFPEETASQVAHLMEKLRNHPNGKPPLYWRAVAFLARTALILADHQVSSLRSDRDECPGMTKTAPFANTVPAAKGKRKPNQTLQWHLQSVGQQAAAMAERMRHLAENGEGLSPESLTRIDEPATGRFTWQEIAAEAIGALRHAHSDKPILLAVIAGTGSGKTRACARLAVRAARGTIVRWTALFNLRTLTLQTGDDYRRHLGMQESDLAVVIGDTMTREAHETQQHPDNEDDMDRSLGEDVDIAAIGASLPEWLEHFVGGNKNLRDMMAAPVFVSTADYLAPAGNPGAQGRHIMPLLRLMGSDLILDEIDNYDPKAVAAILRLVQLAALFGRNVIASSATMTPALADALGRFYAHGAAMRAALQGASSPDFACGVLSDGSGPSLEASGSEPAFSNLFRSHLQSLQAALDRNMAPPRRGRLLRMPAPTEEAFENAVAEGVLAFHRDHQWPDPDSGKPLSVGLVRVANIPVAIRIARFLRQELSDCQPQVTCYHARLFHGHRTILERDLDQILRRTSDPSAPSKHPSISRHLKRSDVTSGLFIVVATPVEEVGRDHDFDWAIAEPSSAQSLVQVGGRVHRHRAGTVATPNIGVLRYNWRACNPDPRQREVVFCKPGHETAENKTSFGDHDLQNLADWDLLGKSFDARLRFDTNQHPLARADEDALRKDMEEPMKRLTENKNPLWMSRFTYENWPLRERNFTDEWRYDPEDGQWYLYRKTKYGWDWLPDDRMRSEWQNHTRVWLCPSHTEILAFCEERGLDPEWAFTVSVPGDPDNARPQYWVSDYDGTDRDNARVG